MDHPAEKEVLQRADLPLHGRLRSGSAGASPWPGDYLQRPQTRKPNAGF